MNTVDIVSTCCGVAGVAVGALAWRHKDAVPTLHALSIQKRRLGLLCFGAGALIVASQSINLGAALASPSSRELCDDVMFSAAHPTLSAGDLSQPQAFARRFLYLTREVSPSQACNKLSLGEAYTRASSGLVAEFKDEMQRSGGWASFLKRRERENVTIEFLSTEERGQDAWAFRWVEQVRSPRGVALRSENHAGLVRVSAAAKKLEIAEFRLGAGASDAFGATPSPQHAR